MVFSESPSSEALIERPGGKILLRPEWRAEITPEWFQPEYWQDQAVPVCSGGRGGAWFIHRPNQSWVLRQYLRGGWLSKLNRRAYCYTGDHAVRSFAEFRLLVKLWEAGLPVPKPVAANYRRTAILSYRADILVEEIANATTFADLLRRAEPSLWFKVGQLVRRFHDRDVYHADLNCHNILVTDSDLYLIDFDKSRLIPGSGADCPWKRRNLERLERSLKKLLGPDSETVYTEGWCQLLCGYAEKSRSCS